MTLKDPWRMERHASRQAQQRPQINAKLMALSFEESLLTQSEKMTVPSSGSSAMMCTDGKHELRTHCGPASLLVTGDAV